MTQFSDPFGNPLRPGETPEQSPPPAPEDTPPPPPAGGDTRWPLWTAFAALITGYVLGNVLGAVPYAIGAGQGYDTDDMPIGYVMTANGLLQLGLLLSALFFARTYGVLSAARFGLVTARLLPTLGWAIVGLVSYYVFQVVWVTALDLQNETDSITERLQDDPSTTAVALIALFAVVIAPIIEEIFFRGFVFTAMRSSLNVAWAAIGTGVLFGIVHGFGSPIGFLPPLAALGVVLCLVYWKTGSLLPCIGLHVFNNAIALGVALEWTWQIPVLLAGAYAAVAGLLLPFVVVHRRAAAPA